MPRQSFKNLAYTWIEELIEKEYPEDSHPKWVIYPLFKKQLCREMFRNLVDDLKRWGGDKEPRAFFYFLAFQYTGESFDYGASGVLNATDDDYIISIPLSIVEAYARKQERERKKQFRAKREI